MLCDGMRNGSATKMRTSSSSAISAMPIVTPDGRRRDRTRSAGVAAVAASATTAPSDPAPAPDAPGGATPTAAPVGATVS